MPERYTNGASAYDKLRAAVLSLDLVPGEGLSERGLEEFLGASRTPIRAALVRLENEGLTARQGRGWQVAPLDLAEVRAVVEHREVVEVGVVRLAVERAEDEELRELRAVVADHVAGDEQAGLQDGADFHVALARLSRNHFLVEAVAGALTRLARTRWLEVRTPESRATARAEHLGILDAVAARNSDLAVELVTNHTRGTRDRMLGHLTEERLRLRGRGFAIVDSTP